MDTQNLPNNSAKRLLEILLKINNEGSNLRNSSSPYQFFWVFCGALDVPAKSEIYYSELVKLFILIEKLENDIQKLPILKTNLYIKTIQ